MRLFLLIKWFIKHLYEIEKLEELYTFSNRIKKNLCKTLIAFECVRNEFQQKCEPIWDVQSAVHLLCTGSYKLLPARIKKDCSFCINFNHEEKSELIHHLNNHIKYQITSSTLPQNLKLIQILDGMAILEFSFEYRVSISLQINSKRRKNKFYKRVNWNVFELEIFIQATKINQNNFIREINRVINFKQLDETKSFLNKKMLIKTNALLTMHEILHQFCLRITFSILQIQMLNLKIKRKEKVYIINKQDRYLICDLWKNKHHNSLRIQIIMKSNKIGIKHCLKTNLWKYRIFKIQLKLKKISFFLFIKDITLIHCNIKIQDLINSLPSSSYKFVEIYEETTCNRIIVKLKKWKNFILSKKMFYLKCQIYPSFWCNIHVNQLNGIIMLENKIIEDQQIEKANKYLNHDIMNFEKVLLYLRGFILPLHICNCAQSLYLCSFTNIPFTHFFQNECIAYIQISQPLFLYFFFHYQPNTGKLKCYRQLCSYNKLNEINKKKLKHSTNIQKLIDKLTKFELTPVLTFETIKKCLNILPYINWKKILKKNLKILNVKFNIRNNNVSLQIIEEQTSNFDISKLPILKYQKNSSFFPDLKSKIVDKVSKDRLKSIYIFNIQYPYTVKLMLTLIIQLYISDLLIKQFLEIKQSSGFCLNNFSILPLKIFFINQKQEKFNVAFHYYCNFNHPEYLILETKQKNPHLTLIADELIHHKVKFWKLLSQLTLMQIIHDQFYKITNWFLEYLYSWRSGLYFSNECIIHAFSWNTIVIQNGSNRIFIQIKNRNIIYIKYGKSLNEINKITLREYKKCILLFLIHSPLRKISLDVEKLKIQLLKDQTKQLVVLNSKKEFELYPPFLEYKLISSYNYVLLKKYFKNRICFPICHHLLNWFSNFLYFYNYSCMQSNQLNDRWLSVLELEIKQEEELRIKIHEKFTFMQLNIGSNIKFKNPLKKDFQLGKSWWILFQVDVLSLKSNIFCKNLDKFFWERYVIEDQIKLNLGINLVSNKICIWRKVDKTIEPVLDFKIISNLNGWIRKQKHVNIGSILTEIKTIPFSILKKIK